MTSLFSSSLLKDVPQTDLSDVLALAIPVSTLVLAVGVLFYSRSMFIAAIIVSCSSLLLVSYTECRLASPDSRGESVVLLEKHRLQRHGDDDRWRRGEGPLLSL
ncbi:hypothetical protein F503_04772 [Ophiostoma piceae UAMH 11346]|uniref:Uncharacterized protein n=1 Tax=Ophiostoma piceae (strain UAMH 11346) TaxID=1262450 RepID=S3BUV5_OPHP1|nr:hypothetical protein F503_04772 [Ophiostoma piceae UAMH 11346]